MYSCREAFGQGLWVILRHRSGFNVGLCLEGLRLNCVDRLCLMAAVDDLVLPWRVNLMLMRKIDADQLTYV